MTSTRRGFGRRRTDRFKIAVGLFLGLVLAAVTLSTSRCDTAQPTSVDREIPVAASTPAPTPSPTATPAVVGEDPKAFELQCLNGSKLVVNYNGEASQARVDTWWTSFDDQKTVFGKQQHTVGKGGSVDRTFDMECIQADADQPGVKEIGGCFFDINKKPFNPSRSPEKVKECRDRCTPRLEEGTEYGDWEDFEEALYGASEEGCYKTQRRLAIVYTVNSCTKEKKEIKRFFEYKNVPIECPCVEKWVAQQPIVDVLTQYGECVDKNPKPGPAITDATSSTVPPAQYTQCAGKKVRKIATIINEKNSCTGAVREKSRVESEETADCTFQCLQAICHTQNDKWCWIGTNDCNNFPFIGKVKKWQCQNVPPGTPGHYDNHFNHQQHDDFFGNAPACGPVGGTSDKCYSITNQP